MPAFAAETNYVPYDRVEQFSRKFRDTYGDDNFVFASSKDFPDALSGTYLASVLDGHISLADYSENEASRPYHSWTR